MSDTQLTQYSLDQMLRETGVETAGFQHQGYDIRGTAELIARKALDMYGDDVAGAVGGIDNIVGAIAGQLKMPASAAAAAASQAKSLVAAQAAEKTRTIKFAKDSLIAEEVREYKAKKRRANQLLPIAVTLAAKGDAAASKLIRIRFAGSWTWNNFVVTPTAADAFSIRDLIIAGVPWNGLGVTAVDGNDANPGLSLAIFTPEYAGTSAAIAPFLGETYEGAGEISFVVQNEAATAGVFRATMTYSTAITRACS